MNKEVAKKFDHYPEQVRERLMNIRALIFSIADAEGLGEVTEALKWGEPSYSCKKGSPIRMDWKSKSPQQVSLYFNCNTSLIATFKEIYRDELTFVGNREIVLEMSKLTQVEELKDCLSMALRYHAIKHLPLLGAH